MQEYERFTIECPLLTQTFLFVSRDLLTINKSPTQFKHSTDIACDQRLLVSDL